MKKDPSLFVGNLSIFIKEEDIEALFGQYSSDSESISAKVMKTELGISRGYGFIKMLNMVDAERAMTNLHGKQFHGRPLKVKWSERNARKDAISILENDRKNSVHVKFSSTNREYLVTEETIFSHFSRCGIVIDVSIKQSGFSNLNGLHRGYAFVHFEENASGKDSAIRAATEVTGDSLMIFECQPSHNLLKQFDIANEKSNSEKTDDSISTLIDSIPRLQIDGSVEVSHLTGTAPRLQIESSVLNPPSQFLAPLAVPSSPSQREDGPKPQPYSNSPNDNQQIPQLHYPYPNSIPYIPGQSLSADSPRTYGADSPLTYVHADNPNPTPYIPGQNLSADSPRTYVRADNPLNYPHPQYSRNTNQHSNVNIPIQYMRQNQFTNDNMQQQYLRQQYEHQHYQMNMQQHGYPPRYYIANQSSVPVPIPPYGTPPSGPMPYPIPMSMPPSMPRYSNEFYPHSENRQHPYISYDPYPQTRPPVSYNPNHRYEQLQRHRISKAQKQMHKSSLTPAYIPQLPPSHIQLPPTHMQQLNSKLTQQLPQ